MSTKKPHLKPRSSKRTQRNWQPTPAVSKKLADGDPDWQHKCTVCGALPTVHPMGLCGPCCFGEADTEGGNW